jgi:hypothetical protein
LDRGHYNSPSFEKRHYNSPIPRSAIIISSFPCHFLHLPCIRASPCHFQVAGSSVRPSLPTDASPRSRVGRRSASDPTCVRAAFASDGSAALIQSGSTFSRTDPNFSRNQVQSTPSTCRRTAATNERKGSSSYCGHSLCLVVLELGNSKVGGGFDGPRGVVAPSPPSSEA